VLGRGSGGTKRRKKRGKRNGLQVRKAIQGEITGGKRRNGEINHHMKKVGRKAAKRKNKRPEITTKKMTLALGETGGGFGEKGTGY